MGKLIFVVQTNSSEDEEHDRWAESRAVDVH